MNGTAMAQCSCRSDALNLRISVGRWTWILWSVDACGPLRRCRHTSPPNGRYLAGWLSRLLLAARLDPFLNRAIFPATSAHTDVRWRRTARFDTTVTGPLQNRNGPRPEHRRMRAPSDAWCACIYSAKTDCFDVYLPSRSGRAKQIVNLLITDLSAGAGFLTGQASGAIRSIAIPFGWGASGSAAAACR